VNVSLVAGGPFVIGTTNLDLNVGAAGSIVLNTALGLAGSVAIGPASAAAASAVALGAGSHAAGGSVAIGASNVQGGASAAIGPANTVEVNCSNTFILGSQNTASGNFQYLTAVGNGHVVNAEGASAAGGGALGWAPWYYAISSGFMNTPGDSQYAFWMPFNQTTDATPTALGVNGEGINGTPTVFALTPPDFNHTILCEFRIVARRTDTPGEASVWECNNFVIDGNGTDAYRVVGTGPTVTVVQQDSAVISDGWGVTVSLTEDNTGIQIIVTGAAGQTIQWTSTVKLYEVIG
jgi:hypothetical protein